MALRAYREYARYMVELMRLPSRPMEELADGIEGDGVDLIVGGWEGSGRPMIVIAGHVGNNEAVAAAIASRGLPANVVADDSSFPEIFEILRQQRESWGVHIIPWRNLRELFTVLRRNEIVALLVDWGYRSDGIPVQLFGSLDDAPGRARHPGRQDGRDHRADGDPADEGRQVPHRGAGELHRPLVGPGGAAAGHAAHRRLPWRRSSVRHPRSGTASSRCGPRTRPRPRTWRPGPGR